MAHGSELGFDTTTEMATEILLNAGVKIRKASTQRAGIEGGLCRADGEGNSRLGGGRWTPD
jgi:hypothetical protein